MLYFTLEVIRRLANQNRRHICVMSESEFKIRYQISMVGDSK